jgi:hypothetical protein
MVNKSISVLCIGFLISLPGCSSRPGGSVSVNIPAAASPLPAVPDPSTYIDLQARWRVHAVIPIFEVRRVRAQCDAAADRGKHRDAPHGRRFSGIRDRLLRRRGTRRGQSSDCLSFRRNCSRGSDGGPAAVDCAAVPASFRGKACPADLFDPCEPIRSRYGSSCRR